jgi:hypothetical protein
MKPKTTKQLEAWYRKLTPAEKRKRSAAFKAMQDDPQRERDLAMSVLKIMAQIHRETAGEMSQLRTAAALKKAERVAVNRKNAAAPRAARGMTVERVNRAIVELVERNRQARRINPSAGLHEFVCGVFQIADSRTYKKALARIGLDVGAVEEKAAAAAYEIMRRR